MRRPPCAVHHHHRLLSSSQPQRHPASGRITLCLQLLVSACDQSLSLIPPLPRVARAVETFSMLQQLQVVLGHSHVEARLLTVQAAPGKGLELAIPQTHSTTRSHDRLARKIPSRTPLLPALLNLQITLQTTSRTLHQPSLPPWLLLSCVGKCLLLPASVQPFHQARRGPRRFLLLPAQLPQDPLQWP
jgi:hypothetical protein